MGNLKPSIQNKCEECGKIGYDLDCLQMPDGTYKVVCDECFVKCHPPYTITELGDKNQK